MTEEERQLLLKDLCARLTYGVYIRYNFTGKSILTGIEHNKIQHYYDMGYDEVWIIISEGAGHNLEDIKPYLRSLGVMTREENEEYLRLKQEGDESELIDFYLSHHFDYRHLMDKGLAIPAPEGMYGYDYPKYDSDDFAIEDRCWDDGNF